MQEYIQHELDRKNRWIYFKNGRWMIHVCVLVIAYFAVNEDGPASFFSLDSVLFGFLWDKWLYVIFYFMYCIYLVPVLFKHDRKIVFWGIFIAAFLFLPLLEMYWVSVTEPYIPATFRPGTNFTPDAQYLDLLQGDIIAFVVLTFLLFIMEISEDIKTYKAIYSETDQRLITEQQLIKTRMNPDFMMRSLDGIIQLSDERSPMAPDSVISFSDVLRYRLYQDKKAGLLTEELAQVRNLLYFQNAITGDTKGCVLEISGNTDNKWLPPLTLVNLTESLLNTYDDTASWSLLLYMLVEENELQVAAELCTAHSSTDEVIAGIQLSLQSLLGKECIFNTEKKEQNYSLTLCIPFLKRSAA